MRVDASDARNDAVRRTVMRRSEIGACHQEFTTSAHDTTGSALEVF
jgi:hypothetical protein